MGILKNLVHKVLPTSVAEKLYRKPRPTFFTDVPDSRNRNWNYGYAALFGLATVGLATAAGFAFASGGASFLSILLLGATGMCALNATAHFSAARREGKAIDTYEEAHGKEALAADVVYQRDLNRKIEKVTAKVIEKLAEKGTEFSFFPLPFRSKATADDVRHMVRKELVEYIKEIHKADKIHDAASCVQIKLAQIDPLANSIATALKDNASKDEGIRRSKLNHKSGNDTHTSIQKALAPHKGAITVNKADLPKTEKDAREAKKTDKAAFVQRLEAQRDTDQHPLLAGGGR